MGSKKDKGILDFLSYLGAFCTEGPKTGFTKAEVFVSTLVSLWQKYFRSKIKSENERSPAQGGKNVCRFIPTSHAVSKSSQPMIQRGNGLGMT